MQSKIINDPVYGFIRIHPELITLISHPIFQRLRNIKQMGMAHFVYPGAVHTRLHHSLGAMHMMGRALHILQSKGIKIPEHTYIAAQQSILLHDIGHGPFSHALEHAIVTNYRHEDFSLAIMEQINTTLNGKLVEAISIFKNEHPTPFLHQLVSGQLDMDRLDYLTRDSFYTGVSEGVIGYDRILEMLHVADGHLVVEEKGIHSVEKFLIARRLMYWQVYLHKTVLSTELLLIQILRRARHLAQNGIELFATPAFKYFLYNNTAQPINNILSRYCMLDDTDVYASIKVWQSHTDDLLSTLCKMLVNRNLFKIKLSTESLSEKYHVIKKTIVEKGYCNEETASYFILNGTTGNDTYHPDGSISILFKDGNLKDITDVENALITTQIAKPIQKEYICIYPEWQKFLD